MANKLKAAVIPNIPEVDLESIKRAIQATTETNWINFFTNLRLLQNQLVLTSNDEQSEKIARQTVAGLLLVEHIFINVHKANLV